MFVIFMNDYVNLMNALYLIRSFNPYSFGISALDGAVCGRIAENPNAGVFPEKLAYITRETSEEILNKERASTRQRVYWRRQEMVQAKLIWLKTRDDSERRTAEGTRRSSGG